MLSQTSSPDSIPSIPQENSISDFKNTHTQEFNVKGALNLLTQSQRSE